MAVVAPEEAAAMFARNPELARAHPDAVRKVSDALAATKAAHDATRRAAPAQTRATVRSAPQRSTGSSINAAQKAIGVYRSIPNSGAGMGRVIVRLAVAVAAFLIALEVASYVSGRYFNYSLGKGAQNLQQAANKTASYVGLYVGQQSPQKAS